MLSFRNSLELSIATIRRDVTTPFEKKTPRVEVVLKGYGLR